MRKGKRVNRVQVDGVSVDSHIGGRIRLRRTLLGMSQTDLANRLGLTFQQVQKYERGSNRVSAATLYQLTDVLDVPLSFFFDGLDNSNGPSEESGQTLKRRHLEMCRMLDGLPEHMQMRLYELMKAVAATVANEPVAKTA